MKIKKRDASSKILAICLTCLVIIMMIYLCNQSTSKLIYLSMIALFAGLLFESFRIADKWIYVLYIFIGSFLGSLLIFLPGKTERIYYFEKHLAHWPYAFLILYMLISVIVNEKKTTANIGEGITLIQSLSIIYWIFDYDIISLDHWSIYCALGICLLFSLFSIVNALTYFRLSRNVRLWLSIWSCIVMMLFSLDNIIRVYSNEEIEQTKQISDAFYIGLQFFLLGVSAIYMMKNFFMLLEFLPGKNRFFNAEYFRELRILKNEHIERYSENQIYVRHAIICIIVTSGLYFVNYTFRILPTHTTIWLGFVLFPFLLKLSSLGRKKVENSDSK